MMNEAKQYTIRILDDDYSLLSDESADHVFEIAQWVDTLAQEIAQKAPKANHKTVLALVALRFARDLRFAQKQRDSSHSVYNSLIESIDRELTYLDGGA